MRRHAIGVFALATLLLSSPAAGAQGGSQDATPAATSPLLRVTLDQLPPKNVAVIGFTRSTYTPGGSLHVIAGSGPTVFLVETGSVSVQAVDTSGPFDVYRTGAESVPEDVRTPEAIELAVGDAIVVPAGETVEIRNDGGANATVLDLLAATDARTEAETGITHAVLSRREATLPAPRVTLTLDRAALAPGERFTVLPDPIQTMLATVERAQTFLLSGESINRGDRALDIYVLTIAPSVERAGTPAA